MHVLDTVVCKVMDLWYNALPVDVRLTPTREAIRSRQIDVLPIVNDIATVVIFRGLQQYRQIA
jgi:hypothetical protein